MGAAELIALLAEGGKLLATIYAENRAATQAEVDALFAAADLKDAAAVAADSAAQKAAGA
jgi:hypothetical protein